MLDTHRTEDAAMDEEYLRGALEAALLTKPSLYSKKPKTALYRYFNAEGKLLYVGISLRAMTRMREHRLSKDWFYNIARIELQWFDNRSDAEDAEQRAVVNEHPIHNMTFNARVEVKPIRREGKMVFDEHGKRVLTPRVEMTSSSSRVR